MTWNVRTREADELLRKGEMEVHIALMSKVVLSEDLLGSVSEVSPSEP